MESVQPVLADKEREELVTDEDLKRAEKFVEEDEGLIDTGGKGFFPKAIGVAAVIMSLFHLYAAVGIVTPHILRAIHLGFVLSLTFLVFPSLRRFRGRILWFDICFALLSIVPVIYLIVDFEDFIYRAITPTSWDVVLGTILILFVLETNRRATGIVMPLVAVLFIIYAMIGPMLPKPWTHRGYDLERIAGHLYITLEGIFGVPIDVSSTFIILFTIFGAFLQFSNAGKFYVDFSFSLMKGKPAAPGRTVTLASFLLGGPSGSGTATTVTLGAFCWPMLAKAGYPREVAGGLLSAGGIGALISPPVLGAAAFIIAELLKISYLEVMAMACVPTLLYYWSIVLMVEYDAKRYGAVKVDITGVTSAKALSKMYWYHFLSLGSIVFFMLLGLTAILSVFLSTVLCFLTSFLRRDTALFPRKLMDALKNGSLSVLSVATTCACAGIIVGIVTLTGLGMKFSSIILYYAEGSILLTTVYCAFIVWILGLAVPVTATYIVSVVMVAPAFVMLGVPDYAAHMFVFYYAILSEVSPPTALSPFAAAAICKGNPYRTTMYAWKYTLPAFLFPFTFVLDPNGVGILLKGPPLLAVWTCITSFIGVFSLASGASRWLLVQSNIIETTLLVVSGLLLVYPAGSTDVAGIIMLGLVILLQIVRKKKSVSALSVEKMG